MNIKYKPYTFARANVILFNDISDYKNEHVRGDIRYQIMTIVFEPIDDSLCFIKAFLESP